ncbi:MAG: 23S rRNA (pseudouridine(1915)-N(3))-methyltransferase RlmH [Caldisericia bacterium]|nr:23S rRNA (pseudouridine(1915)-N(3))-methyltransferase RlmH [Caldisericia bacterium]
MNITIACIGKLKESYWREAIAEYSKRLSRFCSISFHEVKEERLPDNPNTLQIDCALNKECLQLQKKQFSNCTKYALDISGEKLGTEEFTKMISKSVFKNTEDIVFYVGSSYGLSNELKRSCSCISFSKLTFPHQLFRVILLEQIYRSFKIISNEPYHK